MGSTSDDIDLADQTPRSTKRPTGTRDSRPSKRQKEKQQEDTVLMKALECMERSGETKRDSDDIFGEYVANELKAINDDQKKRFIKFQIQSLLFSLLSPQPIPPEPHSNYGAHHRRPYWENPHPPNQTDDWNYRGDPSPHFPSSFNEAMSED